MPLTIPNTESSPTFDAQAVVDSTDLTALAAGISDQGVYVGCAVTPHTGSDMNVAIAAGAVVINGAIISVTAVTSTAIGAASTYDRKDIVTVNSSGTVSVTAGTPCATAGWTMTLGAGGAAAPVKPAIPSNSVLLAEVYVAHATTAIATGNIIDKRTTVLPDVLAEISYTTVTNYTHSGTALVVIDATNLSLTFVAPPSGKVRYRFDGVVEANNATYSVGFAIFTHGGSLVSGADVLNFRPGVTSSWLPTNWEWLITGLTAGTTYQWDLAWGTSNTALTVSLSGYPLTTTTVGGTTGGPIHIMVLAA